MIIELSYHDLDIKEIDLKNSISEAAKFRPDYISVFSYYTKLVKKNSQNSFKISTPIDYPLGISDLKTRQTEISNAIKNGAAKLDIVIPTLYIVNRRYDKFREDIQTNLDLCINAGVDITYMLEYRIFNHLALTKIANIIKEHGLQTIYASTGYMLDDIGDNLIASMYLAKKTDMNTIINGNIWQKDQIKTILNHKPHGIRFKNLYALKLWYEQKQKD
jgi:deoxyribose-phosphate aldolase